MKRARQARVVSLTSPHPHPSTLPSPSPSPFTSTHRIAIRHAALYLPRSPLAACNCFSPQPRRWLQGPLLMPDMPCRLSRCCCTV